MILFIQNVSAADVHIGNHFDCGENAMLIQISDPYDSEVHKSIFTPSIPIPKHSFKENHILQFLDVDDEDPLVEFGCTASHAKELIRLLQHAIDNRMNVVCHCWAGISRSGAIVEVAVMMGFIDPGEYRIPNSRIKRLMMEELGLTLDITQEIDYQIRSRLRSV
jgi:hypothetical protein